MPGTRTIRRSDIIGAFQKTLDDNCKGNEAYDAHRAEIVEHVKRMWTRVAAIGDLDWLDGYRLDPKGRVVLFLNSLDADEADACTRLAALADIEVVARIETEYSVRPIPAAQVA